MPRYPNRETGMLSYIYQIASRFEKTHGVAPTLLYLNQRQYHQLREDMIEIPDLQGVASLLGMEIIISEETIHPHVALSAVNSRSATIG